MIHSRNLFDSNKYLFGSNKYLFGSNQYLFGSNKYLFGSDTLLESNKFYLIKINHFFKSKKVF